MIKSVNDEGLYGFEQKNKFSVGDEIEVMRCDGTVHQPLPCGGVADDAGNEIECCPHPGQMIYIDAGIELSEYDMMRKRSDG